MTLEDFKSSLKTYRRFQVVCGLIFYALLFAVAFPTVFVGKRIDQFGLDITSIVILAVSYPLVALLMFYVMAWLPKRRLRQLGLICPTCRKQLIGLASQDVIATGRCGFCGGQVFDAR